MAQPRRVLVTGSSGRIGKATAAELKRRGHYVRGFDLAPTPGLEDMVVGTLTDRSAVDRATAGMETLVHLAATPDDADFLSEIVPNNIIGVYHVMESAKDAGVKRLVLASSGQVVWWARFRGQAPATPDCEITPRYWYACGKAFLEAAGRSFTEKFGLESIAVRLGWCPRTRQQVEEIQAEQWAQDVYLSPGDAGRFFACCVEADLPGPIPFFILYATSIPKHAPYDLHRTEELVGFQPSESWPQGSEIVWEENRQS